MLKMEKIFLNDFEKNLLQELKEQLERARYRRKRKLVFVCKKDVGLLVLTQMDWLKLK